MNTVDKARLFLRPEDLVDSMLGLTLEAMAHAKSPARDVITKGFLSGLREPMTCLRCNGKTEIPTQSGSGRVSLPWITWERSWATHCVCGGLWIRKA